MKLLLPPPLSPFFRFFNRFKTDYYDQVWTWRGGKEFRFRTMETRLGSTVVEYSLS